MPVTTSTEEPEGTGEATGEATTSAGENASESEGGAAPVAAPAPAKKKSEATESATPCTNCKRALSSSYYQIGQAFVCASCKELIVRAIESGKANQRFLPALAYGVGAAIVGSLVWYAIRKATGYEIGLVSVAIGVFVGLAVRRGSRGYGGPRYQALAIGLTYLSITMTNVPLLLDEIRGRSPAQEHPAQASAPAGDTMIGPMHADPQKTPAAAPPASDASPSEPPTLSGFLFAWVVLLGIALAAPFLAGFENIIGIVIIGFGLYEAWKINRYIPPAIQGPFTGSSDDEPDSAPSPAPGV